MYCIKTSFSARFSQSRVISKLINIKITISNLKMASVVQVELSPQIIELQQFFYELVGDRDWNEYKLDEHSFLKRNIGYGIFGNPTDAIVADEVISDSQSGYNKKQCKVIDNIYDVILANNFDEAFIVHIRFIFICCELPNKNLFTEPVFVIRKCRKQIFTGNENCKIYIDSQGRVYESWTLYLENNKLPKCTMVYPKDGKYSGSITGEEQVAVVIEARESPACNIGSLIIDGTDTAGTVVSVLTTGTFVAAAIPAITVAPIVLAGAAIGGLGVGLYSVARSIYTLVDRSQHKQSIALDNAESRWCWLNTTVGVLGASTSAATGLVTRAVSRGNEISRAARVALNTVTVANVVGSGINLTCTGYHLIDKIINNETVSPLEMFQFASSVLFFHNSVAGFQTANTIISETQTATIKQYEASLRSNRHRKVFKKAQLEARRLQGDTAGNAEIISGMRNINDPDNFFAGLARINKDLNKSGARYTITSDGNIKINSNYVVDPMEFAMIGKTNRAGILNSLPPRQITVPKVSDTTFAITRSFMTNVSEKLLRSTSVICQMALDILTNKLDLDTCALLLERFTQRVIELFLNILVSFLNEIKDTLKDFQRMYPMVSFGVGALQFLISYVENSSTAARMEVQTFLRIFFDRDVIDRRIGSIGNLFKAWLRTKIEMLQNQSIPRGNFGYYTKRKVNCKVCVGYYYIKP